MDGSSPAVLDPFPMTFNPQKNSMSRKMRFHFEKVSRFLLHGSRRFPCRSQLSVSVFFAVLVLLPFCAAGFAQCADFREKPLAETEQKALQATISQLGSSSSRIREKAGQDLLKYGSAAVPFLQEARLNEDLTIAEEAEFYLQILQNGIHRVGDPPQVTDCLKQYEITRLKHLRLLSLYSLTYLPAETSLTPLLRLTLLEKDTRLSQLAALAAYRTLPRERPLPRFPLIFPEERPYPDPNFWETENQKARQTRKTLIQEIRRYLLSEPAQTPGKQLLLALFSLEETLASSAAQTPEASPSQTVSENAPAAKPQENDPAAQKLLAFRNRFLENVNTQAEPMDLLFTRELDLSLCCLLYQAGTAPKADGFFQTTFLRPENQLRNNSLPSMEMHNNFVILFFRQGQNLLQDGHSAWCAQLLDSLWKDMEMREKNHLSPLLLTTWQSLGQYEPAIALARDIRHVSFLSKDSADQENVDKMANILVSLHSHRDIQQQKFTEARTRLENYLQKTPQEELDIDLLILARKLALHTKDDAWLKALDARILEHLEAVRKKITIMAQNPFTSPQDKSHALNEFAWLAANTGFQLEKALEYAQEMTQLRPDSAGLADTLAMVHFAMKDYEKAFEVQKKAHELDPAEPVIFQNLERFRVWLPKD